MKFFKLYKTLCEDLSRKCAHDWYAWSKKHWDKEESDELFKSIFAPNEYRKFYKFEKGLDPSYKIKTDMKKFDFLYDDNDIISSLKTKISNYIFDHKIANSYKIDWISGEIILKKTVNNADKPITHKIGKFLYKIDSELADLYAKEELAISNAMKQYDLSAPMTIVVSRHPYDIAGASTGRAWSSCQNLNINIPSDISDMDDYVNKIQSDIKHGSLIAYLMNGIDEKIMVSNNTFESELKDNKIIGRLFIKRFSPEYSISKKLEITHFSPDHKMYSQNFYNSADVNKSFLQKLIDIVDTDINSKIGNDILYGTTLRLGDEFYNDSKNKTMAETPKSVEKLKNFLAKHDIEYTNLTVATDNIVKVYNNRNVINYIDVKNSILIANFKNIENMYPVSETLSSDYKVFFIDFTDGKHIIYDSDMDKDYPINIDKILYQNYYGAIWVSGKQTFAFDVTLGKKIDLPDNIIKVDETKNEHILRLTDDTGQVYICRSHFTGVHKETNQTFVDVSIEINEKKQTTLKLESLGGDVYKIYDTSTNKYFRDTEFHFPHKLYSIDIKMSPEKSIYWYNFYYFENGSKELKVARYDDDYKKFKYT